MDKSLCGGCIRCRAGSGAQNGTEGSYAGPLCELGIAGNPQGSGAKSRPTVSRCVQFPDVSDGRGFTQARSLREGVALSGKIRAMGYILPDQLSR